MLGGVWQRNKPPIAIDLGSRCVRMLQLAPQGAQWRVMAAAWRTLPVEDGPVRSEAYHQAVGQAIQRMLDGGHFSGKQVVSCLPTMFVQFKNLRLPKMPTDELAAAVEWEAAERLHLNREPMEIRFFDAGEVRQGDEVRQEVILMAAPTAQVEAHVRMLVDCGLQPAALDVAPGALARALAQDDTADLEAPARVIIDVGHASSKVVIARQGRIRFFKLIDIGGRKFDQTVADKLGLSLTDATELRHRLQQEPGGEDDGAVAGGADAAGGDADEGQPLFGPGRREEVARAVFEAIRPLGTDLGRELALCLRYYSVTFRGPRPEEVMLVGGEAPQRWLAQFLAEGTDVTVRPVDPLSALPVPDVPAVVREHGGPTAWAAAVGLALRREAGRARRRAA